VRFFAAPHAPTAASREEQRLYLQLGGAEWVAAVNAHGGFGRWASDVSFNTADIDEILRRHDAAC
jgi:hypothetical protein